MWNQIRVKQEYSKKYTTSENREARYSNAEVYKNYERLMIRFLCHREWWKLMNVGPMKRFNEVVIDETFWAIWWIHDSIVTKPVIVRKMLTWIKNDLL